MKAYDASWRWRIFAKRTTFHGFRNIFESDTWLIKIIWFLVLSLSSAVLLYYTYNLITDFLDEVTVTKISSPGLSFIPRVLIGVPTSYLLRPKRLNGSDKVPEMDPEALLYARSIAEPITYVPASLGIFDVERAKKKFEDYLSVHNLTWAQAIEPYTMDVGPWITKPRARAYLPLRITRRFIWYPLTYHQIEPDPSNTSNVYKPFSWAGNVPGSNSLVLDWSISPLDRLDQVHIFSYDFVNDDYQLRRGDKVKLLFTVTAHADLNLRRKPCTETEEFYIHRFDTEACEELCYLDAVPPHFPGLCHFPPLTRYSFLKYHPRGIPCSEGRFVLTGRDLNISRPQPQHIPSTMELTNTTLPEAITKAIQECVATNCFYPCKELKISYQFSRGVLADDQPKYQSILAMAWPRQDEVILSEEQRMYTLETLIGQWGGLTGLWLGASVMSFVEIVYYWCCCFRFKRKVRVCVEKSDLGIASCRL